MLPHDDSAASFQLSNRCRHCGYVAENAPPPYLYRVEVPRVQHNSLHQNTLRNPSPFPQLAGDGPKGIVPGVPTIDSCALPFQLTRARRIDFIITNGSFSVFTLSRKYLHLMQVSGKSKVITPKNESQTILNGQAHKTKPTSGLSQKLTITTPNSILPIEQSVSRPQNVDAFFQRISLFFTGADSPAPDPPRAR